MKYNLLVGRYCPPTLGHLYFIDSFLNNGEPVCIAIRDTEEKYSAEIRREMFEAVYFEQILLGIVEIVIIPDIKLVAVGRKVGYGIVEVPEEIKIISATDIRKGRSDKVHPKVKEIMDKYYG